VTDPNGNTDTLREIPVTSWTSVLGTQYVVQRNVDVTIPTAYDNDTVKVGWYNIYTDPSNYYSTVLGRFHAKQYSGFVYTAYDSASFAGNSYLYSALAIVKNSHDSIVAFTTDLDTVTAKVGNFSFDSTRFGTGILSVQADSLTIPWYAFNVTNGTSVTAYKSVVKTLDSTVIWIDTVKDSTPTGRGWGVGDTAPYPTSGLDSLGHSFFVTLDSIRGTYTVSKIGQVDTIIAHIYHWTSPTDPTPAYGSKDTVIVTAVSNPMTVGLPYHVTFHDKSTQEFYATQDDIVITSVTYVYRKVTYFYK